MHDMPPVTAGWTRRHARHYDLRVQFFTLGRARAIRRATIDLAPPAPGEAVLDVGCGTGDLAVLARSRVGAAGRVSGIDASPQMIDTARYKAARSRLEIDFRIAAVEALPFPAASFDLVFSSLMMHHLPGNIKPQALAEILRVLKPGGRLLVVDLQLSRNRRARLLPVARIHRHMPPDYGQGLSHLIEEAGFQSIEFGSTRFSYLGFVRALAPR